MLRRRMAWVLWAGIFLFLTAILPLCASETLSVFAAGSLTDPFKDFKKLFESRHPGMEVDLNLAGSPELRTQIELGAPCDLFASADLHNMQVLQQKKMVTTPKIFARNKVCVVIPKANRAGIRSLSDLAKPGVRIVSGHENLPMGKYMAQILDKVERSGQSGSGFKQKVLRNVISKELHVKHILAKVVMDEFDAGFVFISDATPAVRKDVSVIAIPDKMNVRASYPIAIVNKARNRTLAQEFIRMVLSSQGQQILKRYEFLKP